MTLETALIAFVAAASLLTITPGLDTRHGGARRRSRGPRTAALAGFGIIGGCLDWGAAVALGLGVLLAASSFAYLALKWAGAAYLAWLGIRLILQPRSQFDLGAAASAGRGNWWARGFLNNLLNPKIGVFYVSFLPQFTPAGYPAGPFIFLLAVIHAVLGALWFATLIAATSPLKRWLARQAVVRWIDRVTGAVFLGFGLRLRLIGVEIDATGDEAVRLREVHLGKTSPAGWTALTDAAPSSRARVQALMAAGARWAASAYRRFGQGGARSLSDRDSAADAGRPPGRRHPR